MTGKVQNFIPTAEPNCNMLYLRLLLKIVQGLKLIQGTADLSLVLWEPILQKSCSRAIYVRQTTVSSCELSQGHVTPISPLHSITPAVSSGPQVLFLSQKRWGGWKKQWMRLQILWYLFYLLILNSLILETFRKVVEDTCVTLFGEAMRNHFPEMKWDEEIYQCMTSWWIAYIQNSRALLIVWQKKMQIAGYAVFFIFFY